MTHVDPNDVGRMAPEDRSVHAGFHHRAPCGEWRPTPSNKDCPACPEKCPECGAYRINRPGGAS